MATENLTVADGQLAASAATLVTGATTGVTNLRCSFFNTAGTAELVVITFSRAGGTSRRIAYATLQTNEALIINCLAIQPGDTLYGTTTNASGVDYVISTGAVGAFQVYTLDANGAFKSGSAAIGSGNLTITGDLTVSGGDIDAGASGAAGTVDIFPTTASKGKIQIAAADSAGNTTTTITNASQSGARTYTIPDAGASASFVMTAGAQTVAGAKTFSTMPIIPSATVAAAGSDQSGAAAITTGGTLVTAADGTKGVSLPTAVAGLVCLVKNDDAANAILKVYPATGDGINAIAVNSAISMAAKTSAVFWAYDATTWYTIPLLPS